MDGSTVVAGTNSTKNLYATFGLVMVDFGEVFDHADYGHGI